MFQELFAQSRINVWQQLLSPTGMLFLLALGLAGYLMLRNYWLRQQQAPREKPAHSTLSKFRDLQRDAGISDAPVEVLRWEVEMHKTARDLKAELDSKILALQAVTKEAQAERLRLEEAIRKASSLS
jgi:hypothetical protein